MLKNYLVTAIRNFASQKQYAILSILVMVIGLTTASLSFLYAQYEFSYEDWIKDSENIYRFDLIYHFPGADEFKTSRSSPLHVQALKDYFPEIEGTTHSVQFPGTNLRFEGEDFTENNMVYVDSNFIKFFNLEMVNNNKQNPLQDLNSILISEESAQKYFGDQDPIGQVFTINNFRDHRVVGVFRDLPENTHMAIDFLALYDESMFTPFGADTSFARQWNSGFSQVYLKLNQSADIEDVEDRLDAYLNDNYVHPNPVRAAMTPTEFVTARVQPISEIHLFSENVDETIPAGSIGSVIGLIVISALILSAVTVNYINLATAQSSLRAREIGLRKTLGAKNINIKTQFILEAVLISGIALIISLVATSFALPYFIEFLNLPAGSLVLFKDFSSIIFLIAMGVSLGFVAGIYPAFFLSKIMPREVLSSKTAAGSVTAGFRTLLVTLQFAVSVGLLISIFMVFRQTQYVTNMDIGVETDNISVVGTFTSTSQQVRDSLITEFKSLPGVLAVGASSQVPTNGGPISTAVEIPGHQNEDALSAFYASVDEGFFEVYDLKPISGRLLSEDFPADRIEVLPDDPSGLETNILVNEKSLPFLGVETPDQAIGKRLRLGGSNFNNSLINVTIVGVVPDFHFGSAFTEIQPTFFIQREDEYFQLSIRTTPEAFQTVQGQIDEIWGRILPDEILIKTQMDEMIAAQYDSVARQGNTLLILSSVAILIAGLGIYGMASFIVERKTQEIGIRKVLGAKVKDVLTLLILQFSKPIVLANIIAWPVAWYFISDWLNGFSYRIDMSPMPFLLAGLISLLVAWAIVSTHAFRAARSNPIHALRYE